MLEREESCRGWCLVAVRRAVCAVVTLPILLGTLACGTDEGSTGTTIDGDHGERDASSPDASPSTTLDAATGPSEGPLDAASKRLDASDSTVFSEIDVRIRVYSSDSVDSNARDEDGNFLPEPPIVASRGARIEINDGTAEGRVSGLRVFSDGEELTETGSAGSPQKFSFQRDDLDTPDQDQDFEISFRYEEASYAVSVSPLEVELTSPTPDQMLRENDPLTLEWTGIDVSPEPVVIGARGQSCILTFTPIDDSTFVQERKQAGQEPPCRFELSADWAAESVVSDSAFRSLVLVRAARRIRRFSVE